ncbi:MAG: EamA family transporter [Alphaproteobacteria bacterium]|nr:EamA family transporter [Alphaproteobacteria bacterium]
MDTTVFFAVLAAAAMHAGWNAVVKIGLDQFLTVTLVAVAAGAVALACLPFTEVPTGAVWYWILASAVLHTGYKIFLVQAYKAGDLGQVYPLARGAAPLIVAAVSLVALEEGLDGANLAGIGVLVAGVLLMSLRGGHQARGLNRTAVLYALGTSCFIAGYTLVDGLGARQAASAMSYTIYLFVIDAVLIAIVCLAMRGWKGVRRMEGVWKSGLAGGALSLGAYWIAIWAMTQAPIATVAALRETSVLFAIVIATVVLKEKLTPWRLAAAFVISGGTLLLRL